MTEEYRSRFEGADVSIFGQQYIHYRYLIPDLEQAIKNYATGKVLDVGCGNKPYLNRFPDTVTEYIGCDVEQSSLRMVDKICPATDLDFEDKMFDTVFCTQVLEHIYDHTKAFFEMSRVLRPGGMLIGSVPMCWPHHEEPYDFFRFTKYGIEGLLKQSKLETVYVKANGGKWALLGQLIILNFTERAPGQKFLSRFKNNIFRLLLGKLWVNLIFGRLDKISSTPEYHNTINFVFVARKGN